MKTKITTSTTKGLLEMKTFIDLFIFFNYYYFKLQWSNLYLTEAITVICVFPTNGPGQKVFMKKKILFRFATPEMQYERKPLQHNEVFVNLAKGWASITAKPEEQEAAGC